MSNFSLDLSILESTLTKLKDEIDVLKAVQAAAKTSNNILVTEAWKGTAKDVYVTIVESWAGGYGAFLQDIETLKESLAAAHDKANTLHAGANAFAGILGGATRGGTGKNILSLDANLLDAAKSDCVAIYDFYEKQKEDATSAQNCMAGFSASAYSLCGSVQSFNATVSEKMCQLDDMRSALAAYADGIDELDGSVKKALEGIAYPAGWDLARLKNAQSNAGQWSIEEIKNLPLAVQAFIIENAAKFIFAISPDISLSMPEIEFDYGAFIAYYSFTHTAPLGDGNHDIGLVMNEQKAVFSDYTAHIMNASATVGTDGKMVYAIEQGEGMVTSSIGIKTNMATRSLGLEASLTSKSELASATTTVGVRPRTGEDPPPLEVPVKVMEPVKTSWLQTAWVWGQEHQKEIAIGVAITAAVVVAVVAAPLIVAAAPAVVGSATAAVAKVATAFGLFLSSVDKMFP